ncbi:YncE family protein [Falsigemmobacter faecalis]|uniref:ATP-binding protein n=1 Tax=Falsigemmobacter faecalis TaxID=2488730 RepID=A0A3P3D623_9RHOB|nr:ATP-binding protein [Falsigemmobacter faecalis]RRH69056.1 ATP-binding protein [Falsigemmobacter faecalis]
MTPSPLRALLLVLTCLTPALAQADVSFPKPEDFKGRWRVESATPGLPVYPGGAATISGSGLQPGQKVWLQRGPQRLLETPLVADDKGAVSVEVAVPQSAARGLHPIVALLEEPSMTALIDLKVSGPLEHLNVDKWSVTERQVTKGLYQAAFSAAEGALYVAGADFYTGGSELVKLNPDTLEVLARITPADFPQEQRVEKKGGKGMALAPAGVYGVATDDSLGHIWVTNTPDNTIAVYKQSDLSLVRQLPPGSVYHAREVLVDPESRQAFVSSSASSRVYVFNSETFEKTGEIDIRSAARGGDFYVMNLAHNPQRGELYVTSRISNELAVVDVKTLAVKRVLPLAAARNATGVATDPASGRIFVAAQDSDNLLILDGESGDILHDVTVGAGALSVTWDAKNALAWVASRGAGSLSAVDAEGRLVAHLEGGSYANHITTDGRGRIFALNKALGPQDPKADFLRVITRAD